MTRVILLLGMLLGFASVPDASLAGVNSPDNVSLVDLALDLSSTELDAEGDVLVGASVYLEPKLQTWSSTPGVAAYAGAVRPVVHHARAPPVVC